MQCCLPNLSIKQQFVSPEVPLQTLLIPEKWQDNQCIMMRADAEMWDRRILVSRDIRNHRDLNISFKTPTDNFLIILVLVDHHLF